MLPPNFLTIPQIQHERHAGSKLMHLTTLLEFLLKLYNPNVTAAEEGRDTKVGERVIACQEVFSNFKPVLTALRVRNSFAHVMADAEFTAQDHQKAVDCLLEAIGELCRQSAIPQAIRQAIYHDPDADLHSKQAEDERKRREQQAQLERDKQAQDEQARKLQAEAQRLEQARLQHAQREQALQAQKARRQSIGSALRKLVLLTLVGTGSYFAYPKLLVLYKGDQGSATVVRTAAELALKRVREKRKLREYADFINQSDAAWRDGEIEFKRGNFKLAEERYRQVISSWDGLNARIAESKSFEELLTEMNTLRHAATKAQAQQKAKELWQQAEELSRNAMAARRSGNLSEAKNLILQARQQYEAAQAAALAPVQESQEKADVADASAAENEEPETRPTIQPTPVRPAPTVVVQPTVAQRPEPTPAVQTYPRASEDETFTIREKEFLQYVTKRVNPVLPPQASQMGVAGPVLVRVYLSPEGQLTKAEVVEGEIVLREAALTALRRWSFRPYLRNRVPTTVKSIITIQVQ